MESNSSAFRRFKSLPLPFDDDTSPAPRGLPRPFPTLSPVAAKPHMFAAELSPPRFTARHSSPQTTSLLRGFSLEHDDDESRDSALGGDSPSTSCSTPGSQRPLLDVSHDEGFLESVEKDAQTFDLPTSFSGLIKNLLLSNSTTSAQVPAKAPRRPIPRKVCRKGLFSAIDSPQVSAVSYCQKRASPSQDLEGVAAVVKRRRSSEERDEVIEKISPLRSHNDHIKDVLECDQTAVTGDFSRTYALPTIAGKHQDLKSVSPKTVSDLLDGRFSDDIESFTIVDCRYPYEFDGGHIKGALNIWERDTMTSKFMTSSVLRQAPLDPTKRNIVIFHCEFSSERGPKMSRFLRQMDREANKTRYPSLYYPEVYLLEGGYKAFYQTHKTHCAPQTYLPMAHQDFTNDLKHFRVKSKSWAGEKTRKSKINRRFCQLSY